MLTVYCHLNLFTPLFDWSTVLKKSVCLVKFKTDLYVCVALILANRHLYM